MSASQFFEHVQSTGFEFGESEPFFAEVFEGCADVVDVAFVEDEKAVVCGLECFDLDGRVLGIMFREVERELSGNVFGENGGGYGFFFAW